MKRLNLKAQAALIEALVGMMLITVFAAFSSNIAYTATHTSSALRYSNAASDFIGMFYYNKSTAQCILSSNSSCIAAVLEKFSGIYGLSYMGISGIEKGYYGNYTHCSTYYKECFVERQNYIVECIEECGS